MNSLPYHIVIPARLASSRLAEKPLQDIHGKPMIEWVYRQAKKTKAISVTVATDSDLIAQVVQSFNGEVCMTLSSHQNGTDRIVEVCEQKQWADDTVIVNCQGDEPLIPPDNIDQVAQLLMTKQSAMATLHKAISADQAKDPNVVKLVCDHNDKALLFSRSVIPYDRDAETPCYFGHIGLYAYQVGFLKQYSQLAPCQMEQAEKLEQLRALYHGYEIYSQTAIKTPGPGIDTEQDLNKVRDIIKAMIDKNKV